MARITIRDIPERTKEVLRLRAAEQYLSLEAYVCRLLEAAAESDCPKPVSLPDLAQKYFGPEIGVDLELPERKSRRHVPEFDR